jgi:hypothetical protein
LLRIALAILLVSVAVASAIVSVVLAMLLVHVVSIVIVSTVLLGGVAIALIIRLVVVVILLLRRIAAIVSLHRSLLVLVVVCSTRSLVGVGLIVRHATRALAVKVVRLRVCYRRALLGERLHSRSNERCTAERQAPQWTILSVAIWTR